MLATDIAEYLVRKGLPFRETHHIAGGFHTFVDTISRTNVFFSLLFYCPSQQICLQYIF